VSSILYITDLDAHPCVMPGVQEVEEEAAEKIDAAPGTPPTA
jgi:hypothetical protein